MEHGGQTQRRLFLAVVPHLAEAAGVHNGLGICVILE